MIQALIPIVGELASGWLKGKADEKAATSAAKVAKAQAEAEVMRVAATHEAGWERSWRKAASILSKMNIW